MNLFNREGDLGNPLSISCRSWSDAFYFTLVLSLPTGTHMQQCGNTVLARVLLRPDFLPCPAIYTPRYLEDKYTSYDCQLSER